jgi:hypothetical protein
MLSSRNAWRIGTIHVARRLPEAVNPRPSNSAKICPRFPFWNTAQSDKNWRCRGFLLSGIIGIPLASIALCDVFSPAQRRISLREFCTVLDLRYEGLKDRDVERFYREKRAGEIEEHREREVINIFQIWLRREINGSLSQLWVPPQ